MSLIQDVCDILPSLNEKIKSFVMNIEQAPKGEYAGYYTVLLCYLALEDKDLLSNTINRMLLKNHLLDWVSRVFFIQSVCIWL